jgi:hypothetical protein
MARKARKGPESLFDKIKKIDKDFPEGLYSATEEVLNQKLVELAKQQTAVEEEKAGDTDLKSLQAQATFAGAGYKERTEACKLKRRFVYGIFKDRGRAP